MYGSGRTDCATLLFQSKYRVATEFVLQDYSTSWPAIHEQPSKSAEADLPVRIQDA